MKVKTEWKPKTYLITWWNGYRRIMHYIHAENPQEAKKTGFRLMCDESGDCLQNVDVYELKATINAEGEYNPKPSSWTAKHATRDYLTGKKLSRRK